MIRVSKVAKYYGAHAAVRDLTFEIAEGECVGFVGLNGAGKTTTLRLLSCLSLPTSGRIEIKGLDAEKDPHAIRAHVGYLPDRPPLYTEMTVRGFLRFAGKLRQMSEGELDKRMPEVLERTGLTRVADDEIATLSHGYRQRVGIAQAIVHKPALLILDEPIQGLDPVQIVEMRELIRSLRGDHTILLSSHILSEIEQTCDRLLVLREGEIVATGTEAELSSGAGGGTVTRALVSGADADVDKALAEINLLGEVRRGREGDNVRIVVSAKSDARAAVARAIVEAGLDLLELNSERSDLEDLFVSMVKGGES